MSGKVTVYSNKFLGVLVPACFGTTCIRTKDNDVLGSLPFVPARFFFSIFQATAYSDSARFSGGCVQFNKNGTALIPFEYPKRRRSVSLAPGRIDAAAEDSQTTGSGRCESGIEKFPWKHGPSFGVRNRGSRFGEGPHGSLDSHREELPSTWKENTCPAAESRATKLRRWVIWFIDLSTVWFIHLFRWVNTLWYHR